MSLLQSDPEIFNLLQAEEQAQLEQIRLVPSENYVSRAVREAVGSVAMNKYSEGQVGKRFYPGNQRIDQIEALAKERALSLFKLDSEQWQVCVQAATGSIANLTVYNALLQPGDRILSMHLYDGGHLSHGWKLPEGKPVSFTSVVYDSTFYHVEPETGLFDYDQIAQQAQEVKPQLITSGGTAYPRQVDHAKLREIADSVGAYYLADVAHEAGLIAAGVNDSPFAYADVVTMTTRKTLRGPIGALIFSKTEHSEAIARAVFPGLQGGPLNHSIAGIAVALHEASQPDFVAYAKQTVANAQALASKLQKLGYTVLTGGTDKHLLLLDLRPQHISGSQAAQALEQANIIANKNTIPNDTGKPWDPSGLRLGTPAMTTRGLQEAEMDTIADWIDQVLKHYQDQKIIAKVKQKVIAFCRKLPAIE